MTRSKKNRGIQNDPPVRKNGRCYLCGKSRPEHAVADGDPFCSTDCCRKHHKVIDTSKVTSAEQVEADASVAAND